MRPSFILIVALFATVGSARRPETCECEASVTTVSGTHAPTGKVNFSPSLNLKTEFKIFVKRSTMSGRFDIRRHI
jgi:hypothetical protein